MVNVPLRSRKVVGLVAVAAAITTTLSAPSAATTTLPEPALRACDAGSVFFVGDSIADPRVGGSGRHTKASFSRLGIRSHTHTRNGLSVRGSVNERYKEGFGSKQARAATVWVVALGTNDRPRNGTFRRNVRKVLKLAGDREVYWVTTSRPRNYQEGPGGPINRILRAEAKVQPRMHIIDYAVAIKGKKRVYLKRDRVHVTPKGSKWLAALYTTPWQPTGCVGS